MAHKKGQGSSRNGRDSNSQRLGVKRFDGNLVTGGSILVRQRGRKFAAGDKVTIDQVLFVGKDDGSMLSGAPYVAGAKVLGVIAGESRGPKIRVFKKRRRKTMRVSRGHRSTLTKVEIKGIEL